MHQATSNHSASPGYIMLAGFLAFFIGLGLCRFAYTPLIPALINEH